MLPLIPLADRLGQIEALTTYLRKHFGKRPRGCWLPGLIWEQNLAGSLQTSGMDYTFLESNQFSLAEQWPNLAWTNGQEQMAGRTYYWRWHGIETADPQFRAIDVEVRDAEKATDPRATLRSYVSKN
jgi:hypothetical protein